MGPDKNESVYKEISEIPEHLLPGFKSGGFFEKLGYVFFCLFCAVWLTSLVGLLIAYFVLGLRELVS